LVILASLRFYFLFCYLILWHIFWMWLVLIIFLTLQPITMAMSNSLNLCKSGLNRLKYFLWRWPLKWLCIIVAQWLTNMIISLVIICFLLFILFLLSAANAYFLIGNTVGYKTDCTIFTNYMLMSSECEVTLVVMRWVWVLAFWA